MSRELTDHLIGPTKLLGQLSVLTVLAELLPSSKCSEDCSQIVVVDLGQGQLLPLDEVLEQVVSLNIQVVDGLVHSLDAALRRTDEVLIGHDLVNQLLL